MSDCIFCKIISKEIPAQLVFEDDRAVAIKDINPQAPTHILVVPKRHIPSLSSCSDEDTELLGHLQQLARKIAGMAAVSSGFRVVVNNGADAGQSVDHLHYHVLGGRSMRWPPG